MVMRIGGSARATVQSHDLTQQRFQAEGLEHKEMPGLHPIHGLQQTVGNRAVLQMLQEEHARGASIPAAASGQQADSGTRLPAAVQRKMEAAFGMDLSGLVVHPRSAKPAQIHARAYAQGSHI